MNILKPTSQADPDAVASSVESFLERGYLVVETTPSPRLIGDLLDGLNEDLSKDHDSSSVLSA